MDFAKKNDKVISLGVLILTVIFVFVFTRSFFLGFVDEYKIIGGFVKFFFLASIGDFIGLRLKQSFWQVPKKIFFKATIWGLIGSVIVLVFTIFNTGVIELQAKGILPFEDVLFATALFTSIFMNVIFAPTMMAFHRVSDQYLNGSDSIESAVKEVNWVHFYKIVLLRTLPLFWIPAHTITFMLPFEYRVIFAAVLGIALGLLLSLFKK
ncbi:hypothetical protein KQ51_00683 [Candidatus Izimaplasma bacterium HR1]|jgi:hypothetical protein|nr:hypothetical protein KQ51_00683 [Candidatus Izimaplasma bacterium HR1]